MSFTIWKPASPQTNICALLLVALFLPRPAGAFEHEREEMLTAGADDFVAKPFRVATIFAKIEFHLGVRYAYEEAENGVTRSEGFALALGDRLRALPAEGRRDLREALLAGHVRRVRAAVERIQTDDEALRATLLAEVQAFRFDDLLKLLEGSDPAT